MMISGGAIISGETVAQVNKSFPHWFCTNYKGYNNSEDAMPVDMHELRALLLQEHFKTAASDDLSGDLKRQYVALYHSMPAYQL